MHSCNAADLGLDLGQSGSSTVHLTVAVLKG